ARPSSPWRTAESESRTTRGKRSSTASTGSARAWCTTCGGAGSAFRSSSTSFARTRDASPCRASRAGGASSRSTCPFAARRPPRADQGRTGWSAPEERLVPRVLIIEDDTAMSTALRDGFEYEGFTVTVARDGAGGLRLALATAPDVVILD